MNMNPAEVKALRDRVRKVQQQLTANQMTPEEIKQTLENLTEFLVRMRDEILRRT